jgi:hypothetical protein
VGITRALMAVVHEGKSVEHAIGLINNSATRIISHE